MRNEPIVIFGALDVPDKFLEGFYWKDVPGAGISIRRIKEDKIGSYKFGDVCK